MHSTSLRFARASLLILAMSCRSRDDTHAGAGESTRSAADTSQSASGHADSIPSATPSPAGSAATGVEYYPAGMLNHVAEALSRGATTGHTLGSHGTFQYVLSRRTSSGGPEIHDRWIDVTTVQAGRGTLVYGGRVAGGTSEQDGEHRGGTIRGGASRPVGTGDLMVIPAGVPHQYQIAAGDSLRYVTVKVLAGQR